MIYTAIDIIYNPNSTGSSRELALDLKKGLSEQSVKVKITLHATKHAGHAEKIAYSCAINSKRPLIISSSGDGGYNEVVNGAMRAQQAGAKPTCAVLPAGNANDHSRTVQDKPLLKAILAGYEVQMDLLKATYYSHGKQLTRYAHSYIGLGLTPVVALELNTTSLNVINELWIVLKTFYKFRPFKIKRLGRVIKIDSILFANIGQMAKILTISKKAKTNDGLFEVVLFPHKNKLKLIHKLAKASTTGLEPKTKTSNYEFNALKKMPVQFDGEVRFIDKGTPVRIVSDKRILTTIV